MRKIAADRNYIRLKQAGFFGDVLETGKEMLEDPKGYISDKAKENISAWIKANAAQIATEATKGLPMGGYIGQFSGQMVSARADEISECIVDIALGS
jgi:hypothetical protein